MQTDIKQFIQKSGDDAVTDVAEKRAVTTFDEKMRIDDKSVAYPTGNRMSEPPLNIVIPEKD